MHAHKMRAHKMHAHEMHEMYESGHFWFVLKHPSPYAGPRRRWPELFGPGVRTSCRSPHRPPRLAWRSATRPPPPNFSLTIKLASFIIATMASKFMVNAAFEARLLLRPSHQR